MGFNMDPENTGFKQLEEGWYEVYPHKMDKKPARSGNKMAVVNYIVRDDVEQAGQGQEIRFDNFVETPNAMWRVNQAGLAAGISKDEHFEDIYEWADRFKFQAVRVKVKINADGYPEVSEYAESMYGGQMQQEQGQQEQSQQPSLASNDEPDGVDLSDDDLPF